MYYEEKLICGILHWRGTPDGEWKPMSKEQLTAIVMELRQQRVVTAPMPYVNPAWQRFYGPQHPPWAPPFIVTCKDSPSKKGQPDNANPMSRRSPSA